MHLCTRAPVHLYTDSMRAYLDIETTYDNGISVVGIHIPGREMVQLAGVRVTDLGIAQALEGVATVVTFNGTSFDLPFIRRMTGLDVLDLAGHRDLLHACRRRGLKGGLKRIEALLGIARASGVVDGRLAPRLWQRWETEGDEKALALLLRYNRDDCVNLEILESILDGMEGGE